MGFPFEIITMLGSTVLGGVMSVWAESRKDKAEHQKLLIQWTRRIIALSSVFAIVILPKLVAVYYPTVDVTVGYTNFQPGFLFLTQGKDVFEWITFQGLVITQLDTNLVSAIIGMYFGGSLVSKK